MEGIDVNPKYGELISEIRRLRCPDCRRVNEYVWLPGFPPLELEYICKDCGARFELWSDD